MVQRLTWKGIHIHGWYWPIFPFGSLFILFSCKLFKWFIYLFIVFCINFESCKLTMGLKLLIVVVLISTLILFFHIWYIIIISLFCDEKKLHLGIRSTHHQLGLELNGHSGQGRDGVINSFVNGNRDQSTCLDTGLC